MQDILAFGQTSDSAELLAVCRKAVIVATQVLDTILTNGLLQELKLGIHNNQFIMIGHAIVEILQASILASSTCRILAYANMVFILHHL